MFIEPLLCAVHWVSTREMHTPPVLLRTRVLGPACLWAPGPSPSHLSTPCGSLFSLCTSTPDREPCHLQQVIPTWLLLPLHLGGKLLEGRNHLLASLGSSLESLNHLISQPQPALWVQRRRRRVSIAEWAAPTPKGAPVPTTSPPLQGSDPPGHLQSSPTPPQSVPLSTQQPRALKMPQGDIQPLTALLLQVCDHHAALPRPRAAK